ncbi:MAG: phosphatase PAP2 family protein [Lachnospiraceae bacterium]|nr:phosphatase PAP2 family protein [Lachnospiraceae bacterium]
MDASILLWIQEYLRTPWLSAFFRQITKLGNAGIFWILAAIFFLCFTRTRKIGIEASASLLLSFLINNVFLKNVVARIRPYEVVDGLHRLIEKQSDFSFPSGHTASSFAVAVILYLELPKKYGVPFMILAVLISFSRLYLGVHYPSDVLAGAVSGSLIAWSVHKIKNRLVKPE